MGSKTYHIEHVQGWSKNTHFGREIMSSILERFPSDFGSLAEAKKALAECRARHGGEKPGRFDIVSSNGQRYPWQ